MKPADAANQAKIERIAQQLHNALAANEWRDQYDANQARRPSPTPMRRRPTSLMLYTSRGHSVSLEGHFKGETAFLILSGPSTQKQDLKRLEGRGFLTMCVNNSWSLLRPNIWTSVDDPCTFLDAGWKDPGIMKLVPYGKQPARLGTKLSSGKFRWSRGTVDAMPNVWYYKRNEKFNTQTYLTEETVNWGCHQKVADDLGCRGSRSVMLAAFRLLYYLGFNTINLVGADFEMSETAKYAFKQERDRMSIKGNNNTYRDLNKRFAALKPQLAEAGVKVFNLSPTSKLEAFEHKSFDDATLGVARRFASIDTDGWYTWHKGKGKKLKPGENP